ncbi:hypothetical protein AMTR_s00129p00095850 [Amborella trichopoda]|uniref:Uncharacterized protein n=1 Tax=Amborella trichopoda TaxID=13333 RepID=W1NKQ5_AMBTC|nr:hypothetical protein AMTR_s00129p00095850 [Amborella trichopoda]
MAKIHPQASISPLPSSSPSPYTTSGQEAFTIWMKSLVFNSNGCTVFDSKGRIVYRVDNYDCKCNDEVYLMDLSGKLVFAILRKKLRVFGRWEGFKCKGSMVEHGKPWFQVRKPYRILKRDLNCEVTVGCSEIQPIHYRLEGSPGKASCKIVDRSGAVVAEAS